MAYGAPPPAPDGAKPVRPVSPGQAQLQAKMRQMQAAGRSSPMGAKGPPPRMPTGAPGQGPQYGRPMGMPGPRGAPIGPPDPALKAQRNAQMLARFPNGPPGGGIMGGAPQMGRPPVNIPGAKPPAPYRGGAFGMRPMGGGGAGANQMFGVPTKAPLSTGQANPFAGSGAMKAFGFG